MARFRRVEVPGNREPELPRPRPSRGALVLGSVLQDLRFGLRSLRRRPLFASVTIATLAVGIGAATAMFSVVDGVLVRDLPYQHPGELVTIWETAPIEQGPESAWGRSLLSYPEYERLRDGNTVYRDVAIYGDKQLVLTGDGPPLELTVGGASASLAAVLEVRPVLGRWFLPGEEGRGARLLAVLSHGLWQGRFGGDPAILGRAIVLNDVSYTVVGVLPPDFRLRMVLNRRATDPGDRGVWVPVGAAGFQIQEGSRSYEGLGRLRPGATIDQALAETDALVRGDRNPAEISIRVTPRKDAETGDVRSPLFILFAATAILLGVACGNVVTLLLGETAYRRTEMATRAALGASAWRIGRQLIVENLSLGLLGAATGAVVAFAGTRVLVALGPPVPRLANVVVNGRVLAFAALAGVVTGLVVGLFSAVSTPRSAGDLRAAGTDRASTRGSRRFQRAVVCLEVALTTVLLVGSGLLVRSLSNLLAVDPGFVATDIAVAQVKLPVNRYPSPAERSAVYRRLVQAIEALPPVRRVSGTHRLPFLDRPSGNSVRLETWDPGRLAMVRVAVVLPGFHEMLGIPVLAGRAFTQADEAPGPAAMIVSEAMARRFWPEASPIGTRVQWSDRWWTVVGVAGDVKHAGLDADIEPTFYVPHAQAGDGAMTLVARTVGDPERVLPHLQDAVWSIDPDVAVTPAGSLRSLIGASTAGERHRTMLMSVFGVMAALIAAVAVFGNVARSVSRRLGEMGLRLALGASGSRLAWTLLRSALVTAAVGIALGLLAAFWASSVLAGLLFGVEARDPLTFASVALLLAVVCALASLAPARRVMRVDPASVLRAE